MCQLDIIEICMIRLNTLKIPSEAFITLRWCELCGEGIVEGVTHQLSGRTDGRMDILTNVRNITPFYRTLSPIGAVALLPPIKT